MAGVRRAAIVAMVAALAAAGCGSDSEKDAIASRVNAFRATVLSADGGGACAMMTQAAQDVYANIGKAGSCEKGFEQVADTVDKSAYEGDISPDDVTIEDDHATVTPADSPDAPVALVKSGDDEWLIERPGR
jgi:hypothetical protein